MMTHNSFKYFSEKKSFFFSRFVLPKTVTKNPKTRKIILCIPIFGDKLIKLALRNHTPHFLIITS